MKDWLIAFISAAALCSMVLWSVYIMVWVWRLP
jgi:hypothetical protein